VADSSYPFNRPLQNSIVLAPPLIITEDEIGELFRRLRIASDVMLAEMAAR
jgi:adenosylmethionine-8-amino-7-oxononanoate aminotransferase